MIFLAESALTMEQMADKINDMVVKRGRAIVVVSEGCDVGDLGYSKDSFGHAQFSASQTTVQQALVNYLNKHGSRRPEVPADRRSGRISATQRSKPRLSISMKRIESDKKPCSLRWKAGGYMSTILREPGMIYQVRYDKVPLERSPIPNVSSRRNG
jgi:6-phosphofructokinase 1